MKPTPTFVCNDGEIISKNQKCDGFVDCFDGTDQRPENLECEEDLYFNCQDGSFAHFSYGCDGNKNCPDGSDEWPLNKRCNEDDYFKCDGDKYIGKQYLCDGGFPHCNDGTDQSTDNCGGPSPPQSQQPIRTTMPPIRTTMPPMRTTQPPRRTTQPPMRTTIPPMRTTIPPKKELKTEIVTINLDGYLNRLTKEDKKNTKNSASQMLIDNSEGKIKPEDIEVVTLSEGSIIINLEIISSKNSNHVKELVNKINKDKNLKINVFVNGEIKEVKPNYIDYDRKDNDNDNDNSNYITYAVIAFVIILLFVLIF